MAARHKGLSMTASATLSIGLIGPLPPPAGGMANQTMQLSRLLGEAGMRVKLIRNNAPYAPAWVGGVPLLRAGFRLLPYLWRLWRAAGRCDLFHVMANSGWSWHLFAAPAIWIARARGIPVIVNYRGGEAEQFLRGGAVAVRFTMKRAAALVVPSGFLQQVFARYGMPAKIVPNIIDLEKFHPAEQPPAVSHVLLARNLEPLYDIDSGLRAMATLLRRHPRARMSIAGSGPERERLEALAQALGIAEHVRFTGRLDSQEMAALYREASLSLNTALADNMPNSVLEALACGLPVVSSEVGGVPFLVRHEETALLVPPGDAEAMASAMLRLIEDDDLRQKLIHNGREHVQSFTWARVGRQWLDLYREALA
ncbi:MAG: glycosyltransferase family 4 protein [Pseudomonadota bacterium]|nr:glycosyltransferase family 4 protein [Pseudomonadota bacterium]MDP1903292.1 glycosyltransferase family 4 protein [Pseudomonadota bacterium]MDP2353384.1 glycosyltransferase family 4 protein [Pseudomonadota bacterium]